MVASRTRAGDARGGGEHGEGVEAVIGDAIEHGHARERPGVGTLRPLDDKGAVGAGRRGREADPDVHAIFRVRVPGALHLAAVTWQPMRACAIP